MARRSGWGYWPVVAAGVAAAISLPARLSFREFLTADSGANLAATLLARMGQRPNLDFGYPFGPLSLALQQAFLAAIPRGPYAMAALTVAASLLLGWGASWAIRRLKLEGTAAALMTVAAVLAAVASLWPPVYTLEAAALLWALVSLAAGERGRGLVFCVVAALLKPTMGVVLGALFVAEGVAHVFACAAGRRGAAARSVFLPPVIAAVGLSGALALDFGVRGFLRLAIPLAGARNYRASHFSFFSRAGNPFLLPGARLGYYLGTPVGAWGVACLALLVGVAVLRPARRRRWWVASCCLLGTIAFLSAFYSWKGSYCYYTTLPLIGLAMLEAQGRAWRRVQAAVAALVLLGTWTAVRGDLRLWRGAPPAAATAGLWATPADAAEWSAFAAAHPPQTHPLLLIASGSPEAIFPQYGPPWHGFLYAGEATPPELAALAARAAHASCAALGAEEILPPLQTAPLLALRPVAHGALFDTYGCLR